MAYEIFGRRGVGRNRASKLIPMITIVKDGFLHFNRQCYEKFLQNADSLMLMYDREARKVGIKPISGEMNKNAFPLKVYRTGSRIRVVQVGAKRFLDHFAIPYTHTAAYICEWNEELGILEIQIDPQ